MPSVPDGSFSLSLSLFFWNWISNAIWTSICKALTGPLSVFDLVAAAWREDIVPGKWICIPVQKTDFIQKSLGLLCPSHPPPSSQMKPGGSYEWALCITLGIISILYEQHLWFCFFTKTGLSLLSNLPDNYNPKYSDKLPSSWFTLCICQWKHFEFIVLLINTSKSRSFACLAIQHLPNKSSTSPQKKAKGTRRIDICYDIYEYLPDTLLESWQERKWISGTEMSTFLWRHAQIIKSAN